MTKYKENPLEQLLYNNAIPIITFAVTIAISWASLRGEISLINQKLDYLVNNQREYIEWRKNMEARVGQLSLKVNTLEAKEK